MDCGISVIFEFGEYKLDIDVSRTRRFYEAKDYSLWCDCAGCRNFREAHPRISEAVRAFFRQLGVAIGYPAEISAVVSRDGNMTLYDGFYHLCGSVLEAPELYIQIDERSKRLDENATIRLPDDCTVYFTEECGLVDEDFPRPVIQLEFQGYVPWVLDEPNPYHFPEAL